MIGGRFCRVPTGLAVAGAFVLSACTSGPPAPPSPIALLDRNPACTAQLPRFGYFEWVLYPAKGAMTTGSGGGWCWVEPVFTRFGTFSLYDRSIPIDETITVASAPGHGEIMIGRVGDGYRLAYRPISGYAGPDSFHLLAASPYNSFDIPFTVTVLP